eukprot:COSAG06_NODE_1787_length_8398_cov_5.335944_4_plen_75_part_00
MARASGAGTRTLATWSCARAGDRGRGGACNAEKRDNTTFMLTRRAHHRPVQDPSLGAVALAACLLAAEDGLRPG